MNILIPVILGAGALIALTNTAKLADAGDKLMIDPEFIAFKGIKSGALHFEIKLQFRNPSSKNIYINYLFADILLGTGKLAQLNLSNEVITQITAGKKQGFEIKAQNTSYLTIPFKITAISLISNLGIAAFNYFKDGNLPKEAKMTGYVNTNNIRIPLDYNVPLSKPKTTTV